jgi:hypothetical protein
VAAVWHITGWAGERLVFEKDVPADGVSDGKIRTLLRLLAASHLAPEKIVEWGLPPGGQDFRGDLGMQAVGWGKHGYISRGGGIRYKVTREDPAGVQSQAETTGDGSLKRESAS